MLFCTILQHTSDLPPASEHSKYFDQVFAAFMADIVIQGIGFLLTMLFWREIPEFIDKDKVLDLTDIENENNNTEEADMTLYQFFQENLKLLKNPGFMFSMLSFTL